MCNMVQCRHSWSTTWSSQRLKYQCLCSWTRNEAAPEWEFLRTVAGQRKGGTTCLQYSEGSLLPSIAMYSSPHVCMERKTFCPISGVITLEKVDLKE